MDRVIDVARECGYLDGLPEFRRADSWKSLPREKVVALLTGSQGEPRAALGPGLPAGTIRTFRWPRATG